MAAEEDTAKEDDITLDEWIAKIRQTKLRPTIPNAHKKVEKSTSSASPAQMGPHDADEFSIVRQSLRSVSGTLRQLPGETKITSSITDIPQRLAVRTISGPERSQSKASISHARSASEIPRRPEVQTSASTRSIPSVDEDFPLDSEPSQPVVAESEITASTGATEDKDVVLTLPDEPFPLDSEADVKEVEDEGVTLSSGVVDPDITSLTLQLPKDEDFPLESAPTADSVEEAVVDDSAKVDLVLPTKRRVDLELPPTNSSSFMVPQLAINEQSAQRPNGRPGSQQVKMFSLGSNAHSQLSLEHTEDVSIPTECVLPTELLTTDPAAWRLFCGGNHTFLLTGSGDLYGCGSNEQHQLGLKDSFDVKSFKRIHEFAKWKHVVCGFSFSILVTEDDRLYSAGACAKGSLGLTYSETETNGLQKIDFDLEGRTIQSIQAGIAHVVMRLSDSSLWGWGSGRQRRLGKKIFANTFSPALLAPFSKHMVFDIVAGKDWTAVLTSINVQTTNDGKKKPKIPETIELNEAESPVVQMTSNWATLHLLKGDGSIASYGRNDHGQHSPSKLPFIRTLSSGSEHSIAIGLNGSVYVWGWNEHGNCGEGPAQITDLKELVLSDPHYDVHGVAAGYGTSFVW